MPCYTVTTVQIEFGIKTDGALLFSALQSLGLNPYGKALIYFQGGTFYPQSGMMKLEQNGAEELTTNIRRAYGAEIAKQTAKKYGWTLQAVPGKQFEYLATKR